MSVISSCNFPDHFWTSVGDDKVMLKKRSKPAPVKQVPNPMQQPVQQTMETKQGLDWKPLPGSAHVISTGGTMHTVACNQQGGIFRWVNNAWEQMPGSAANVSIGADGELWAVDKAGAIYRWSGQQWQQMPGDSVTHVSVADSKNIVAVQNGGDIFQWQPSMHTWSQLPGKATKVAIGVDGELWAVNAQSKIYRSVNGTWTEMPGAAVHIAVGSAEHVYAVNAAGKIYRWNNAWQEQVGACFNLDVGSDGYIVAANAHFQLFHHTPVVSMGMGGMGDNMGGMGDNMGGMGDNMGGMGDNMGGMGGNTGGNTNVVVNTPVNNTHDSAGGVTRYYLVAPLFADQKQNPGTLQVSFRTTDNRYLRHENYTLKSRAFQPSELFRKDATFTVHRDKFQPGFVSFSSCNFPNHFIRHRNYALSITQISSGLDRKDAAFKISHFGLGSFNFPSHHVYPHPQGDKVTISEVKSADSAAKQVYQVPPLWTGLGEQALAVSFRTASGRYLRHQGFVLKAHPQQADEVFRKDATFILHQDRFHPGTVSFSASNFPEHYMRHSNYVLRMDQIRSELAQKDASFKFTS